MADPSASSPVHTMDDLLVPFHESMKPVERFRVGTEAEKCGVYLDGGAVPYAGDRGVGAVLADLAARHGWAPQRETTDGEIIALTRGEASITLEPGAQLELSGAPLRTIHETCAEFHGHLDELRSISEKLGIVWLGLGFHPFAKREDLPWVPKLRYGVMREYLPTRGSMAVDMMLRTCTVQANLDYSSEDDALRKLRVSLRLSGIVGAMFANSPFVEKKITGEKSRRTRVWLNVDPDRSGLLPFAWGDEKLTIARYVEWVLDCPMFMLKRDGKVVRNTGQTFRAFLKDGFSGTTATADDWVTHVNSMFPEVRLKRTLEMRSVDNQSTELVCAMPAVWKGLLYDETALGKAEQLASRVTYDGAEAARADVADHALHARLEGREMAEWAVEVLAIAKDGLRRIGDKNSKGEDETVHLARLEKLVARGMSPADALLEKIDPKADLVSEIIAKARL